MASTLPPISNDDSTTPRSFHPEQRVAHEPAMDSAAQSRPDSPLSAAHPSVAEGAPMEALEEEVTRRLLDAGALPLLASRADVSPECAATIFTWVGEQLDAAPDVRTVDAAWIRAVLALVDLPDITLPDGLRPRLLRLVENPRCPAPVVGAAIEVLVHQDVDIPAETLPFVIEWIARDLSFDRVSLAYFVAQISERSHTEEDETAEGYDTAFAYAALEHGNEAALSILASRLRTSTCPGVCRVLYEGARLEILEAIVATALQAPDVSPAVVRALAAIGSRFPESVDGAVARSPLAERVHPAGLLEIADEMPPSMADALRRVALERAPELAGADLMRWSTWDLTGPENWTRYEGEEEPHMAFRSPDGDASLVVSCPRVHWHGPVTLGDVWEYAERIIRQNRLPAGAVAPAYYSGYAAVTYGAEQGERYNRAWLVTTGTPFYFTVTLDCAAHAAERTEAAIQRTLESLRVVAREPEGDGRCSCPECCPDDGPAEESVPAARHSDVAASPEWAVRRPIHTALLVEAFSYGVLAADFWFEGYRLPMELSSVVDWVAFNVQREFPETFAVLSLAEVEERYRSWMAEHPAVKVWNRCPERNDLARKSELARLNATGEAPLTARPFVELESVVRNAAYMIQREWVFRVGVNRRTRGLS